MTLPAKVLIEIFRGAALFFDQFNSSGWLATPELGVSFPDDDTVMLTVQSGRSAQEYAKAIVANVTVHNHLIVRVSSLSAQAWQVYLQQAAGGGDWVKVAEGTQAGIFDVDLNGVFSGATTGIEIVAYGTAGQYVTFDLLCLCKGLVVPAEGDVVEELRVNWPTLKDGVSGTSFTLLNTSGVYDSLAEHDALIVYLGRSGSPGVKRFGGRVRKLQAASSRYGEKYLHVWGHGHALELQHPPARLTHGYNHNGRDIIEACLALAPSLARYPAGVGWFDYSGAVGNTDDRIASVHDVDFDAENPYTAMMQIADEASNIAGKIGFDIIELPSGCLLGHLRGSLDWTCSIIPALRSYIDTRDACQVVNRQTVYGAKQRSEPTDADAWTESIDGWVATHGTLSVGTTGPTPQVGSKYVKCVCEGIGPGGVTPFVAKFRRAFTGVVGKGRAGYGKINFRNYIYTTTLSGGKIRLFAPDVVNYFECIPSNLAWSRNEWKIQSIALGESNEYNAKNPEGQWVKHGSASWLNLAEVEFEISCVVPPGSFVCIDGLNFGEGAYRGTADDVNSQALPWGVVEAEPVSDTALTSDDACQLRAKSLLTSKAFGQRMIDPVIVEGDTVYRPGDWVFLRDSWWVMREVIDVVRGSMWDCELKI